MGPRVMTFKQYVMSAPARWRKQYFHNGQWASYALHDNREGAWDEMIALGDKLTREDVDRIIGVNGWASPPRCDGCGLTDKLTAEVGQEADYESATCSLCKACLKTALEALEEAERGD